MVVVTNITKGPRGAYLKGQLVFANPGEKIEADDFAEEWFATDPLDHDGDGEKGGAKPSDKPDATADEIVAAIELLDGMNDAHWTAAGLPSVDAVAEIADRKVTRAAIEAAAPDAKRPQ